MSLQCSTLGVVTKVDLLVAGENSRENPEMIGNSLCLLFIAGSCQINIPARRMFSAQVIEQRPVVREGGRIQTDVARDLCLKSCLPCIRKSEERNAFNGSRRNSANSASISVSDLTSVPSRSTQSAERIGAVCYTFVRSSFVWLMFHTQLSARECTAQF